MPRVTARPPYPSESEWQVEEEITEDVWEPIGYRTPNKGAALDLSARMGKRAPNVGYRVVRKDVTYTVED